MKNAWLTPHLMMKGRLHSSLVLHIIFTVGGQLFKKKIEIISIEEEKNKTIFANDCCGYRSHGLIKESTEIRG
jgi:hypothetical protein